MLLQIRKPDMSQADLQFLNNDDQIVNLKQDSFEPEMEFGEKDQSRPVSPVSNKDGLSRLRIRWSWLLFQLTLHLAGLYGVRYLHTARWSTILFVNMLVVLGAVGVVVGAHRYWSHRSFQANLGVRLFMLFCFYLACQGDLIFWVRLHRAHHKWSETDADPHNARRGFFFSHIGWLLTHRTPEFYRKAATLDLSDLYSDPIVRFQRRHHFPLLMLIWIVFPVAVVHYLIGESWMISISVGVGTRYVILNNIVWLANSAAHLYGERPYQRTIGATEASYIRQLLFGDGTHNYHHTFPWDYSSSELGIRHMYNPAAALIEAWAALGWAWNLKKANPALIRKRMQRSGDPEFHYPTADASFLAKDYLAGLLPFTTAICLALISRAVMAIIGYIHGIHLN